MPRVQVYLPDNLHRVLKRRKLSPSELLQRAIRDEEERRRVEAETERYFAELEAEVPGEPSRALTAWADALAERVAAREARAKSRARRTG